MIYMLDASCDSAAVAVFLRITKNFINILQIVVPVLLILMVSIELVKIVMNPDDKKKTKSILNKFIAAVIIFFLPMVVDVVMDMAGSNNTISACWNAASQEVNYNPNYIKTNDEDKLRKTFITDASDYQGYTEKEESDDSTASGDSGVTATGKGNFTKYTMTESQLKQITAIALHEQGTAKGAAAEASLMANRFELYGSKYGSGASGLVNYVRKSGWFANASKHMADTGIVTTSAYNAVKAVLVEGKRTLPKYVDEHDCFSDLSSVKTNGSSIGIKNRSSYKQHNTIIKNRYGATYTFYSFPDSGSDPFGYTSTKKRQQYGDDCYSFSG